MEVKEIEDRDNIGVFWSRDGMRFYMVLVGEVLEFTLPTPFSRDFRLAVYVGKHKLIK